MALDDSQPGGSHQWVTERVKLPTWNMGFKLSAQKPVRGDGGQPHHQAAPMHSTPSLGSARRVPAEVPVGMEQHPGKGPMGSTQRTLHLTLEEALLPGSAAPLPAVAHPTAGTPAAVHSLADDFEALALATPSAALPTPAAAAHPSRVPRTPAAGRSTPARGVAGTPVIAFGRRVVGVSCAVQTPAGQRAVATSTASPAPAAASQQRRPRQAGRPRVSFGGAKVSHFDVADGPTAAGVGQASASNTRYSAADAGHTPYSGAGGRRASRSSAVAVPCSLREGCELEAADAGVLGVPDQGPDTDGNAGGMPGAAASASPSAATPAASPGSDGFGSPPSAGLFGGFTGVAEPEESTTPKLMNKVARRTAEAEEATPGGVGVTPKQHLTAPARVPTGAKAPPAEVRQLLRDGRAPAPEESAHLGRVELLSPVRSTRKVSSKLGAGEQVLTPVRRSARQAAAAAQAAAQQSPAGVEPMLEATNFCYLGAEAADALAGKGEALGPPSAGGKGGEQCGGKGRAAVGKGGA